MSINWDAELLGPVMAVFGEGSATDPLSWPTYTPKGGAAFQLPNAVFDEAYTQVTSLAEGSQDTTQRPILGVRASLFLIPPKQDDTVYIPSVGKTFGVADPQPDGHGHIKLMLIEVA